MKTKEKRKQPADICDICEKPAKKLYKRTYIYHAVFICKKCKTKMNKAKKDW